MSLCDFHYSSSALRKQTGACVILPETGDGPFPVLYLLHGLSDDYTMWQRRTSIERYAAGLPLIIVLPDGGRGFYSDAAEGYAYDTALAVELVDRIDRTFPTRAERAGRCVAGLSMGGYGALKFALGHPDRFCAAVSHSGALGWAHNPTQRDGTPLPAEWIRIYGAEPMGGPHDLFALAEKVPADLRPEIRIDCGTEDGLITDNQTFHAFLETKGIAHEYVENPGKHDWAYWDKHILDSLAFFQRVMGLKGTVNG